MDEEVLTPSEAAESEDHQAGRQARAEAAGAGSWPFAASAAMQGAGPLSCLLPGALSVLLGKCLYYGHAIIFGAVAAMEFDRAKFKQLVHYIIWKVGKHDWFGATKLNKVLWFVDARAYTLTGHAITGETYTRGQFGPVPQHILQVRAELERERIIKTTKEDKLTRIVALVPADPGWFTASELQSIEWWASHIAEDHTAASISEETHDYAWEIAKEGEELPLYAYRVARVKEPSKEDLERLRNRAKELGLM